MKLGTRRIEIGGGKILKSLLCILCSKYLSTSYAQDIRDMEVNRLDNVLAHKKNNSSGNLN